MPEKLNVAVRKPSVCGRNCTLFVQLLCVASVTPQVMVCTRKALGSAPVSPKLKFVCEPVGGAKKVPGHIAKRQRGRHHCHRLHKEPLVPCAMRDAEKPVPTQPATDRTPMIPPDKFATLRQPGISSLNRQVAPASR